MAGVSHHSWDLETEVPTVLTRATVADGKYIQKDTIDPLINRDEALKSWLEDTGDELIRVSGELMDTISSVSSTLDTKIDVTSAALHNEITATSASLHEEITATSASLHEELTAASADLYSQTTAVSSNLYTSLTSTSSTLNTKIDTASGNIMSAMKTSADNLILYTNSASAYVQGNLQTSADTLVSALNDLDTEFNEYLSALSANVSSNYVQKGGSQSIGQIAVWESVNNGLKVSGRSIETQASNITVDGSNSTSIPTVGAVAGAIYDATTGKLDKISNATVGNVVVVDPDGTNLSASNYTLGASIPTPDAANKVLKTDSSNVPTWVDEDIVPIKYTQYNPTASAKVESIKFTRNSYGGNDLYVYLENQSGDSKHYALFPYDSEAGIVKYNGRGKYSVAELPVYNYELQDHSVHTVTGVNYMDGLAGDSVLTLNTDDGLKSEYTLIKKNLAAGFLWNRGAGMILNKMPTGDGLFGVKSNGDFEAIPSYSEGYGIIIRDDGTVMTKARVPETGNVVCPPYSVGNDWTIIGDLGNNKLMCKYFDASSIIIGLSYLGSGASPRFTFIGKKITGKANAVCSVIDVSSINQLYSRSGGQMFLLYGEDMDTEARVNIDGIVFGHTSLHIVKYKDENGNIRIGYTAFQHFENT